MKSGDEPQDDDRNAIPTRISRRMAVAMTAAFVAVIVAVPAAQLAMELARGERPGVARLQPAGMVPSGAELAAFADTLRDDSLAAGAVRPGLRSLLVEVGGRGSASAIVGADGWLYFAPGVRATLGRGFLHGSPHARPARAGDDAPGQAHTVREADPRPAIRAFAARVRAAGGTLVLLPVPDKSAFYPRGSRPRAARNASFSSFVDEMRRDGIEVLDVGNLPPPAGEPRYLADDTHWTPQWAAAVARELADLARQHGVFVERSPLTTADVEISAAGDLAELLGLPAARTHAVKVRRVTRLDGQRIAPDHTSPVLLLGDSFTNIYSAAELGWGDGAGLAEQLSLELGGPIDWVARNDAGAHATRDLLARERASGTDRLIGKRLVIWEFADRELCTGNWRAVD
jgi:alginate O-acetyltransferase complex protein AlgJ